MNKIPTELKKSRSGQTLITLLIFISTAIIITSGAVTMTIINSQSTSIFAQGEEVYAIAEAGVDNAILRTLRNPAYNGETLFIGNGTVTITASGTSNKTIVSEGVIGDVRRKIQVVGSYTNNVFTVSSWSEID